MLSHQKKILFTNSALEIFLKRHFVVTKCCATYIQTLHPYTAERRDVFFQCNPHCQGISDVRCILTVLKLILPLQYQFSERSYVLRHQTQEDLFWCGQNIQESNKSEKIYSWKWTSHPFRELKSEKTIISVDVNQHLAEHDHPALSWVWSRT